MLRHFFIQVYCASSSHSYHAEPASLGSCRRCFAASPFTLQTYDRVTRWRPLRPPPAATAPALQQAQQRALRTPMPPQRDSFRPGGQRQSRWDRGAAGASAPSMPSSSTAAPHRSVPPAPGSAVQVLRQPAIATAAAAAPASAVGTAAGEPAQQDGERRVILPPEIIYQAPRLPAEASGQRHSRHRSSSRRSPAGSEPPRQRGHSRSSSRQGRSTSPARRTRRSRRRRSRSGRRRRRRRSSRSSSRSRSRGRRETRTRSRSVGSIRSRSPGLSAGTERQERRHTSARRHRKRRRRRAREEGAPREEGPASTEGEGGERWDGGGSGAWEASDVGVSDAGERWELWGE